MMPLKRSLRLILVVCFSFSSSATDMSAQAPASKSTGKKTLNILFVGNSYTARHNLAQVVKAMAEAGNPGLTFHPTEVIYGGRTLADHWRLATQNYLRLHSLTRDDEEATIMSLETLTKDPSEGYAGAALKRHRSLLAELESQRVTRVRIRRHAPRYVARPRTETQESRARLLTQAAKQIRTSGPRRAPTR